ncbi:MAG: dipeptide epimerase [Deltaproteobacteria bacterium]|nr:dipeptide epimerase [Deltaproteobacteria bacterium]
MKIKKLDIWRQEFTLTEPYTIAYETIDRCVNVFVSAQTASGITGLACSAPDFAVTKETPETVEKAFHNVIEPLLKDSDPFTYIALQEKLKKRLRQQPSALALADMLLYDLMAKQAGVPLYKYLGGYRHCIKTSVTIGIMPLHETVSKAWHLARQGFKALKIKGGQSVEDDIKRVRAVRRALGPKIEIRFDANQGYNSSEAIYFFNKTCKTKIELIEQPTSVLNENLLGRVTRNVRIPIMADEAIKNLKDVFRLTKKDLTDMINIKLMKVGGITEALNINAVAKAAGVEVMIGCMDESSLAIAAGLHFALARPNVHYADLDSFLDIKDDPYRDIITVKNGVLYPNRRPGLGA